MIDFGLLKLVITGAIALVVIGPEKLPTVARMAGSYIGRLKRYIEEVKSEVHRQVEIDNLRQARDDVLAAVNDVEHSVNDHFHALRKNSLLDDVPDSSAELTMRMSLKAKYFRQKKLAQHTAIPFWYKKQTHIRQRILSGSARVKKYRSYHRPTTSFYE